MTHWTAVAHVTGDGGAIINSVAFCPAAAARIVFYDAANDLIRADLPATGAPPTLGQLINLVAA